MSNNLPTLPDGFKYADFSKMPVIHIVGDMGFVTINFTKRGFCLGAADCVTEQRDKYVGSGWKERLVNDAIGMLISCGEES